MGKDWKLLQTLLQDQFRDANDDDIVKSLRGNMEWHHDSTYMPIQAKGAPLFLRKHLKLLQLP